MQTQSNNPNATHVPNALSPQARREQIAGLLTLEGECAVEQLAERFGVCAMTIRRDLHELAEAGRVVRTHGGAAPSSRVSFEFQFLQHEQEQQPAKQAIARTAAALVQDGQSVLLDSGTTTLAVARHIKARSELTVITTSLPIASELYTWAGGQLILLGGVLRNDAPDLVGPLTEQNLETLHADIAIIGADGVDEQGWVYNRSPAVGRMLERMAQASAEVYIVADHSKLGGRALYRFGRASDWAGLITDSDVDPAFAEKIKRAGVNLINATGTNEEAA